MTETFDIGFISANHVARVADYEAESLADWGELDRRTREEYDPRQAAEWMDEVAEIGFDGVSLWTPHCWYHAVDEDDVGAVREIANERGLEIYAYAGGFGHPPADGEPDPRRDWERTFAVADALGCGWLAGGCDESDRGYVAEFAEEYGVELAYENHPEGSAEEILAKIEGYEDCMGVAFDTGWAGTQGFAAPGAIRELGDHLLEVHLKDVRAAGAHETCALGDGVVDVEGCLDALDEIGFDGWVSIEHEPFDRNPMPEVETSYERILEWRD